MRMNDPEVTMYGVLPSSNLTACRKAIEAAGEAIELCETGAGSLEKPGRPGDPVGILGPGKSCRGPREARKRSNPPLRYCLCFRW